MADSSTDYFVHPQGLCETTTVGRGTRVWAFAHVLKGARLGRDCNICDHVFVENDVIVGDRVTVKCGVQLWDGIRLEDDVFVGPNATFTNDPFPRSKQYPERFPQTIVRKGASIGANATLLPGVEIGAGAMVGAGAVVTRSVPENAIMVGNPARIVGYVQPDGQRAEAPAAPAPAVAAAKTTVTTPSRVRGVSIHRFPRFTDQRGTLALSNIGTDIPFVPERCFLVYGVPAAGVRGEHAHRTSHEFLVCSHGSCSVVVDDGHASDEVRLDSPTLGLYMPPMTWTVQYKFSPDAVLVVLASHPYDTSGYIHDYRSFVNEIRQR